MPATSAGITMAKICFDETGPSSLRLRLHGAGFGTRPVAAGTRHRRGARARRLDRGLAVGLLAQEQVLDLVAGERLELEQALGQRFEVGTLLGQDLLRL